MSRWSLVAIFVALVVLLILRHFGSSQERRMEIARKHIPKVEGIIQSDRRFADIVAIPYTGKGGCLGIHGHVGNEQDLADLKRMVEATSPPVTVEWMVLVLPPDAPTKTQDGVSSTKPTTQM